MVNDRWLSRSLACAMAFVVLLVTGCAQSPSDREAPNPDFPSRAGADTGGGESAALGLVNLWRVSGVAEEQADTWLRLDAGEFQLWRDCGMIQGAWQATETRFLASVHGASGDCVVDGTVPRAEWLDAVTGYRAAGAGWELTDVSDAVVATLAVDGAPEPIPTAATFYAEPPVITDNTRQLMRQAGAAPARVEPGHGGGTGREVDSGR